MQSLSMSKLQLQADNQRAKLKVTSDLLREITRIAQDIEELRGEDIA